MEKWKTEREGERTETEVWRKDKERKRGKRESVLVNVLEAAKYKNQEAKSDDDLVGSDSVDRVAAHV